MKLKPEALESHLRKQLAPVYLLCGDEPLQLLESADSVRNFAREAGYSERTLFEVKRGFDWDTLLAEGSSLSLFAEKRIIEVRIPSGKPGRDGSAALAEWLANPPPDILLILVLSKLESAQRNTKWFKAIDKAGVIVQVWPVSGRALQQWMKHRAQMSGLQLDDNALQLLVQHTEGNLLAASQELEKLRLIHGEGKVSVGRVASAVSGNSRYTPFEMVDTALAGQGGHALHMLAVLRAEGIAMPVLLWALARDVRLLVELATAAAGRGSPDAVFDKHRVWEQRRTLLGQAMRKHSLSEWQQLLSLVARIDNAIKGGAEDQWLLTESLLAGIAGYSLKAVS